MAQLGIARPGPRAHVPGARRQGTEGLDRHGHIRIGEADIAVASLVLDRDETVPLQPREMAARSRERDPGLGGELGRREGEPAQERHQHRGAGGIADQRGNDRDVGAFTHGLSIFNQSAAGVNTCYASHAGGLPVPWTMSMLACTPEPR